MPRRRGGRKRRTRQGRKADYEIHPQFGTQYYARKAPDGWYHTKARTKAEAVSTFQHRYHVPRRWVEFSPIYKNGRQLKRRPLHRRRR